MFELSESSGLAAKRTRPLPRLHLIIALARSLPLVIAAAAALTAAGVAKADSVAGVPYHVYANNSGGLTQCLRQLYNGDAYSVLTYNEPLDIRPTSYANEQVYFHPVAARYLSTGWEFVYPRERWHRAVATTGGLGLQATPWGPARWTTEDGSAQRLQNSLILPSGSYYWLGVEIYWSRTGVTHTEWFYGQAVHIC
jgi:hypothetical protein